MSERRWNHIAVYIMANKRNGTIYLGVTRDLVRRAWEHREGALPGFTRRYGLKMLVWYEVHGSIGPAIQRERNIKSYPRAWKLNLIEQMNPDWQDLYPRIAHSG